MATPEKAPFIPTGDPLIDEVRSIRHKISEEFGNDVKRLAEHLREIERNHQGRVLQPADLSRAPKNKAS
jgi:hypothetical protein